MKMFLRNTTVLFAALLLVGASDAFAQKTANADASTDLEVLSALTLNKDTDIDFGQVFNNGQQTLTLSPVDGSVSGNSPRGTSTVGKFIASGQNSTEITVNFSTATLTGPGSDLTFTADVNGSTSENGATAGEGSTDITSGNAVTTTNSGKYFFWVGGTVEINDSQAQGTYQGTFTLDVEYTNL